MFIKIHGTVDWSNVMTDMSLPQRVAKIAEGGWSCLFINMHLTLKGWFERKQLVQILMGYGGATGPKLQTLDAGAAMPCHKEFQRLQEVGLCPRLQTCGARVAMSWVLGPDPRTWLQTRG